MQLVRLQDTGSSRSQLLATGILSSSVFSRGGCVQLVKSETTSCILQWEHINCRAGGNCYAAGVVAGYRQQWEPLLTDGIQATSCPAGGSWVQLVSSETTGCILAGYWQLWEPLLAHGVLSSVVSCRR